MNEIQFIGTKLNLGTIDDFVHLISENIETRRECMQVTGVNPRIFMLARTCVELKSVINQSDLVNIDGIYLVRGVRLFGYRVPERVACCDIFTRLMELASKRNYNVFFLGTSPEMLELVVQNFQKMYPSVKIAGYHHGYYKPEDEKGIAEKIRLSKADMLFVGMPSPKKELFIFRNKASMQIPFSFGVGGLFDIFAGKVGRAPLFMQRAGLEWLYRLIREPRKMFFRNLVVFEFLIFVMKEKIKSLLNHSAGNNNMRPPKPTQNQSDVF